MEAEPAGAVLTHVSPEFAPVEAARGEQRQAAELICRSPAARPPPAASQDQPERRTPGAAAPPRAGYFFFGATIKSMQGACVLTWCAVPPSAMSRIPRLLWLPITSRSAPYSCASRMISVGTWPVAVAVSTATHLRRNVAAA